MDYITNVLIPFAVTVATLYLKNVLDERKESKSQSHLINKLYFERKLAVSEAYVAQSVIYIGTVPTNMALFKHVKDIDFLSDNLSEGNQYPVNNLENSIKDSMENLNSIRVTASALSLFYDVADVDQEGFVLINGIHDRIADIQRKSAEVLKYVDVDNIPLNGYDKALQDWQTHIQSIVDKYQATIEPVRKSVKLVRDNVIKKPEK
jgi:hypothetical protein